MGCRRWRRRSDRSGARSQLPGAWTSRDTIGPMLESLSERLQGTFRRLGSSGRSPRGSDVALREVRVALLEADVNFKVVTRVRRESAGARRRPGGDAVDHPGPAGDRDREPAARGDPRGRRGGAAPRRQRPTKIMVVGAKGAGKTTLCGRLALNTRTRVASAIGRDRLRARRRQ